MKGAREDSDADTSATPSKCVQKLIKISLDKKATSDKSNVLAQTPVKTPTKPKSTATPKINLLVLKKGLRKGKVYNTI